MTSSYLERPLRTEAQARADMAAKATCPQCDGDGYLTQDATRPTCCGNVWPTGECRSHCAVPEYFQEQVPCESCGGMGESGK